MSNMKGIFPEIIIKENDFSKTEIYIDGKLIKGACGYSIQHEAGQMPVLSLDFPALHMTFEGKLIPKLPEVFEGLYEPIKKDRK